MKKIILLAVAVISTSSYSKDTNVKKELLADIKEETKKCAVQIVAPNYDENNETIVGYKSICKTLTIISTLEARILIDGEWLDAKISESKESDGGDLDDLTIFNHKGKVIATKTNVPSYDNVIVAMAGDSDFGHKEESQK